MNKETRTFIWGLIMVFMFGATIVYHGVNLKTGVIYNWHEWILFSICVMGFISGLSKVIKTTD